jgi:hypothetical protein
MWRNPPAHRPALAAPRRVGRGNQRRADGADQPHEDEKDRANHGAVDAHVAHVGGTLAEAIRFLVGAPEQFNEQRPANVEGLVHVRVHLGVGFHLLACQVAQTPTQPARDKDEQRQDDHADNGQFPFEGKHDSEDRNRFDDIGDNVDDGVADGILRADHIVVQAAHQFPDFGIGEEAQTHPLQFAEERHA